MSNINDLIDWFEFSLSDSDKIRVQELDSTRNEDNETEVNTEISNILGKYNSPAIQEITAIKCRDLNIR